MAETTAGAGAGASNGEAAAQQQLVVNAQYVKDLSFENPRAPQSLMQQGTPPEVQIGVDVKAQSLGQDIFEVLLTINANAKSGGEAVFMVELTYAALVTLRGAPQELLAPLLLVETPRLMFPFARAIISSATREGGFPPLLIHPVDFADLLRRQQGGQPVPTATA